MKYCSGDPPMVVKVMLANLTSTCAGMAWKGSTTYDRVASPIRLVAEDDGVNGADEARAR